MLFDVGCNESAIDKFAEGARAHECDFWKCFDLQRQRRASSALCLLIDSNGLLLTYYRMSMYLKDTIAESPRGLARQEAASSASTAMEAGSASASMDKDSTGKSHQDSSNHSNHSVQDSDATPMEDVPIENTFPPPASPSRQNSPTKPVRRLTAASSSYAANDSLEEGNFSGPDKAQSIWRWWVLIIHLFVVIE